VNVQGEPLSTRDLVQLIEVSRFVVILFVHVSFQESSTSLNFVCVVTVVKSRKRAMRPQELKRMHNTHARMGTHGTQYAQETRTQCTKHLHDVLAHFVKA
jgi:hypothetical protein